MPILVSDRAGVFAPGGEDYRILGNQDGLAGALEKVENGHRMRLRASLMAAVYFCDPAGVALATSTDSARFLRSKWHRSLVERTSYWLHGCRLPNGHIPS